MTDQGFAERQAEQLMHPEATSVRVDPCPFSSAVHILLLDANGKTFSICAIPIDGVEEFCTRMRAAADANRSRLPALRVVQ